MKKYIFVLILISLGLSACNLPRRASTATPEEVETQVNRLLTSIPTLTANAPTSTLAPTAKAPEPTQTTEPTATTAPTLAPIATTIPPTAVPSQSDPRIALGEPTRKDDMKNGGSFFDYSDDHVKFEPSDEAMLMTAVNPDAWHGWSLSGISLKDAYIEMTATPGTCAGLDQYGLMVRSPDPSQGYFFAFSCDGKYSLRKWDGKDYTSITDWTASDKINPGSDKANRLGIKTVGNHFTFYANGSQIGEASDTSYSEGKLGLFIAAASTSNFKVSVDEVDYWIIQ
jgi:hypothetical protein